MNLTDQSKKSQLSTPESGLLDLMMSMQDESSSCGHFLISRLGEIYRFSHSAQVLFDKSSRFTQAEPGIYVFKSETDQLQEKILQAYNQPGVHSLKEIISLDEETGSLDLRAVYYEEVRSVLVSYTLVIQKEALAPAGDFYKHILDQLPADIALFNSEHKYVYVNKKAIKDPEMRNWIIGKDDFQYCLKKGVSTEVAQRRRSLFNSAVKENLSEIIEEDKGSGSSQSKRWRVRRIISAESPSLAGYFIGYGIDITEIEEERLKYKQILNSLNDAVIQTNQNLIIQYYNKAFNQFAGANASILNQVKLTDFIVEEDQFAISELISKFKTNTSFNAPAIKIKFKGTEEPVWVELKLSCLPSSNSEDFVFYAIIKNIQEEKDTEETIYKLKMAIESSVEGVAIMNNKDQYTYLNKAHIECFGYEREEEILGHSWRIFYPDQEIERIEKEVFPKFMEQGYFRGPTKGLKKDGTFMYQNISLTTLPDGGLVCLTHDITKDLERQKQIGQLALVAEKTNSIVLIADAQGRIDWVNHSFEQLTGYLLQEIKGLKPAEFLSGPETDQAVVRQIVEIGRNGKHYKGEILNYDRSGKKFWLYIDVTPIKDESGAVTGFIAVENNITAIKNAEEKAIRALKKEKQLNQMKSHFVSLVSHEFRTPLATIQSSMEILNYSMQGDITNQANRMSTLFVKHQQRIETEIKRMTKIMDNALILGRIDAGKMLFSPEWVHVDELIIQMLNEINLMPDSSRSIKHSIHGQRRTQTADPLLLRHVFLNLISNAVKYSEGFAENPVVEINFKPEFLQVNIIDFGMGIPESEIPNLFKSFYRASNSLNIAGTGLGLVIVKQLLEIHKGRVKVKQNKPTGSIFSVELPYTN
jgi:PAS domain S-box-containing protein